MAAADRSRGDVALWTGVDVDAVVQDLNGRESRALLGDWTEQEEGDEGEGRTVGMEVWGERELCALHALWWRARRGGGERAGGQDRLMRRGVAAARWLLENLQPDNATNLPWSVHVWVMLSEGGLCGVEERSGFAADAHLYAEVLLHNCQVGGGLGHADARSGWILLHAARELESW